MTVKTLTQESQNPRAKRFYKEVSLGESDGDYAILLDGRAVKTPLKRALSVPSQRLAELVAEEWQAQQDFIEPQTMVLTGFCNAAIDHIADHRAEVISAIVGFAETDTLSYRDDPDAPLFARQQAVWEPIIRDLEAAHGVEWARISGVMPQPQSPDVLALAQAVVTDDDAFRLTAFSQIVELTGSFALALALREARQTADAVWDAAFLEQLWQAEQWGEDAEATAQLHTRRERYDAAVTMWGALAN
ncbi:MAG: ATP12 family protein [Pseudomonadota bacterium]